MDPISVLNNIGRFIGIVGASAARKSDQVSTAIAAVQIALHESENFSFVLSGVSLEAGKKSMRSLTYGLKPLSL